MIPRPLGEAIPYGAVASVQMPPAAYAAALAMGYHHLGDFHDPGGTLHSERDLHTRVPRGRTLHTIWDWLHWDREALHSVPEKPVPRWHQAPRDWTPGPISPCQSVAVIGDREAKTTREQVIYQRGCAVQLTTALEDVMATLWWAVVLPVCEQPTGDFPSDTCLHRLLVSLLDISVQVEPAKGPASDHTPAALGERHRRPHNGVALRAAGGLVLGVGLPSTASGAHHYNRPATGAMDRASRVGGGTL